MGKKKTINASTVENISVSELIGNLARTGYLCPYINNGDKEPIWDGSIYVYKNQNHSNDALKGRVPVQVKGKKSNHSLADTISYSIKTSSLKNYLNDGGILFFVVSMNENGSDNKIYFAELLPYKLKSILNSIGSKKTKKIKLLKFPDSEREKLAIFFNFLENRQKQSVCIYSDLEKMENFFNKKDTSIGFNYIDIGNSSPDPDILIGKSIYFYGKNQEFKIPIPVGEATIQAMGFKLSKKIICNNKPYYNEVEQVWRDGNIEINFGRSFSLIKSKNHNSLSLNVEIRGSLNERMYDLSFLIDFLKENTLSIYNSIKIPIKFENNICGNLIKNKMQHYFDFLTKIKHVLNILGVKDDLDLDNLDEIDIKWINVLINHLLKKKKISLSLNNIEKINIKLIKIGNIHLFLGMYLMPNGKYVFFDFLNTPCPPEIESSKFFNINKEAFSKASNINYKKLLDFITNYKHISLNFIYETNNLALEMLIAYDENSKKSNELLNAATKLSEWITFQVGFDKNIAIINYFQCIKRIRNLSEEELMTLCCILDKPDLDCFIKICIHILIDNFTVANVLYLKLTDKDKKHFDSLPICFLWENRENNETH